MSTTVTGVTNHFPAAEGSFETTLSNTISSGVTVVPLAAVPGYVNGEVVVFTVDPSISTKKQTFTGIIDAPGLQVTNVVWTSGTNQSHAVGAQVVDYATATHISMMTKGLLVEHKQTGAHSNITADSITTSTIASPIITEGVATLEAMRNEIDYDFVASGCVWAGSAYGSTLTGEMTAGVVYIGGKRAVVGAVAARSFTASKDTYVYVDNTGALTYTEVTSNTASPSLPANSLLLAIIVSGASSISSVASINQGQLYKLSPAVSSVPLSYTDSLGNMICNRSPKPNFIFHRTAALSGITTAGTYTIMNGGITVKLPDTNRYMAQVTLTGTAYNNTTNQYSYYAMHKNGVYMGTATNDPSTLIEIAHRSPLGDSIAPLSMDIPCTAVNNDFFIPYVKVTGGYGGFPSGSYMTVRVFPIIQ